MKTHNLSITAQSELLGRLFVEEKLIDSQQIGIVKSEIEKPSFNYGVDPDTAWMFYNNVTHAFKQTHPRNWMNYQSKFHKFMMGEVYSAHAPQIKDTATKEPDVVVKENDEMSIEAELKGLKKINKNADPSMSTRMKQMILSVNGDSERKTVREFVDTYFLASDARAFRKHVVETSPDVDLNVILDSGEEVTVPIGLNFFWPDFGDSASS